MKRLYRALCKRFGSHGMTLSAWAWARSLEGKDGMRIRIDGAWMLLFKVQGHCQKSFQLETRGEQ